MSAQATIGRDAGAGAGAETGTRARLPQPAWLERLEAPLAALDRLPPGLRGWCAIHSIGELAGRLDGVERSRLALVRGDAAGFASGAAHWLPGVVAAAVCRTMAALRLPSYCESQPDLADPVLRSLLWHLDRIAGFVDRGDSPSEALQRAMEEFHDDWSERTGEVDELVLALGDLGELLKDTRWDQLRGLLRSEGWQDVLRVRQMIERLPELAAVIRRLGRSRAGEDDDPRCTDLVPAPQATLVPQPRLALRHVPEVPGCTRGVHRSDRVARMLPGEAMLLNEPRLRLVWHARRAERALLAYEEDDRLPERVEESAPLARAALRPVPRRRREMGPILVCVDTSGSMQGGAEAVAKAVVLEAARTARGQQRACHVFAFGGPDELIELELTPDFDGLQRLARFMEQSFHGGTDICGPIERVLQRHAESRWRLADLLIASDGEFGATPEVARAMTRARHDDGLRVQGVLIGDRETIGMRELCDAIFWVREWRRYGSGAAAGAGAGAGAGGSPVHTSSLTALYFPGALRDAPPPAPRD